MSQEGTPSKKEAKATRLQAILEASSVNAEMLKEVKAELEL